MKEQEPDFIANLSPFEKFRYNKLSKEFCRLFATSKAEAQDYLDEINLREEEYPYFRYYNNLRLKGKLK